MIEMAMTKKLEDMLEEVGNNVTGMLKACLEYQEDGYVKGYADGYNKAIADLADKKGSTDERKEPKRGGE